MKPTELSQSLAEYLRRCGLSKRALAGCDGGTRLYHDLGIYGDIAEAYMETLQKEYKVDLTSFVFADYFPPEFEGRSLFARILFYFVPFAAHIKRRKGQYLPLTMAMLDQAMRTKRWLSSGASQ